MTKRKGNNEALESSVYIDGYYAECQRTHEHLGGKVDGCQEYNEKEIDTCKTCGCLEGFHRWVAPKEVVYTKCHKIHDLKVPNSVDGCQLFVPGQDEYHLSAEFCEACGCHKSFHRNYEITK